MQIANNVLAKDLQNEKCKKVIKLIENESCQQMYILCIIIFAQFNFLTSPIPDHMPLNISHVPAKDFMLIDALPNVQKLSVTGLKNKFIIKGSPSWNLVGANLAKSLFKLSE